MEKVVPTVEQLQEWRTRFQKRIVTIKDDLDVYSMAIRACEKDIEEIQKEDKEANEANA